MNECGFLTAARPFSMAIRGRRSLMKSMQNSPLCTQVEKPGGYAVESKDEITHQLKVNTSRLNGSDQHVNDDGRSRSYLSTRVGCT